MYVHRWYVRYVVFYGKYIYYQYMSMYNKLIVNCINTVQVPSGTHHIYIHVYHNRYCTGTHTGLYYAHMYHYLYTGRCTGHVHVYLYRYSNHNSLPHIHINT